MGLNYPLIYIGKSGGEGVFSSLALADAHLVDILSAFLQTSLIALLYNLAPTANLPSKRC